MHMLLGKEGTYLAGGSWQALRPKRASTSISVPCSNSWFSLIQWKVMKLESLGYYSGEYLHLVILCTAGQNLSKSK